MRNGLATRLAPAIVLLGLLATACTTDDAGRGPSGPAREPGQPLGFPNTYLGVRDLLYLSEGAADGGGVTFREVGVDAGLEVASFEYGLGAVFTDADLDGDLDLYVANDTKPDRLYDNVPWPGGIEADPAGLGFRFEELAGKAGVADPGAGMGVAAGDDDSDGLQDLFVSNARSQVHGLYRGQVSNVVDPSFLDVRTAIGVDLSGSTGWGVSWADLDLDTDLDLVVVNGGIPVTDLKADSQQIRAFENLTAQGEPGLYADLTTVGLAEVGLGNATVVDRVVIQWPDGQETSLSDVAAGQAITVGPP